MNSSKIDTIAMIQFGGRIEKDVERGKGKIRIKIAEIE